MKLSETTVKKSNNLHFMRFVACLLVIFSHAYQLCGSDINQDFISRYTHAEFSIGGICVMMFFLCSGFLISKSIDSKGTKFFPYIKARVIRIVPPLMFVVICIIIIGAFISVVSAKEYFTSFKTYKYVLNGFMIVNHELPGVFETNPYGNAVNGSLWTIPVEFICYLVCFVFYKLKLFNKKHFAFTLPLAAMAVAIKGYLPEILSSKVYPCLFFYIGMFYYVYREHIKLNIKLAPLVFIAIILSFLIPQLIKIGLIVFLPYLFFVLWFGTKQLPDLFGKTGNISYSVYLWGFFIQQLLTFLWGGAMSLLSNFVLASAISVVLGTITFYVTEKPLLKIKV